MIKGFYLNPLMHDEAADESKSHIGYISINQNLALEFIRQAVIFVLITCAAPAESLLLSALISWHS